MTGNNDQKSEELKKRPGCLGLFRRLGLLILLLIVGFAIWFNGPGVRWLGPDIAKHYLASAGIEGDLKIGGSLLGGLDIYDLDIRSEGSIEHLVIDKLEADYRFSEIFSGKIRGISGKDIHLDLRVIEKEKEGKPPLDLAQLGKTLNQLHSILIPMNVDLENLNISLKKNDELIFKAQENTLRHQDGSSEINLELGQITDALGRILPKQKPEILWNKGKLELDKIDLLPGIGIREITLSLPESGEFEATGQLRVENAEFKFDAGVLGGKIQLNLVKNSLDLAQITAGLGLKLPLSGQLSAMSVEVRDAYPAWKEAQGNLNIALKNFSYDGWDFPELTLDANLDDTGKVDAQLTANGLDTNLSIEATSKIDNLISGSEEKLISGNIKIDQVARLLTALDQKFEWKNDFEKFPKSELSGKWKIDLGDSFQFSFIDLVLKANKVRVSPIRLSASYGSGLLKVDELAADGLAISGSYNFGDKFYRASQRLEDFDSSAIKPWVKGSGIDLKAAGVISLEWSGQGNFQNNTHTGEMKNFSMSLKRDKKSEITASGELKYNWPSAVNIDNWIVKNEEQQLNLDANLVNERLSLNRFDWLDDEESIAKGAGEIPFPKDFSNLKAFVAENTQPISLEIKTETLPLAKLRPWVSGLDQLDGAATAALELKIGGSFAAPVVDGNIELLKIKSISQPKLPSADFMMDIAAKDGIANVSAKITATDFPPATFDATMPFLPKKWASDAESFKNEEISGELRSPDLDISRFQELIPNAKKLGGKFTGNAIISGKVGSPDINAKLNLSDGRLSMESASIPDFNGINFDVIANLKRIVFKGSVNDISGGNLSLKGSFGAKEKEARELNVSIKGAGLPVVRNDFLILRLNTDLSIKGPLDSAQIKGQVGIIDSLFYKDVELIPIGKPFLEPTPAKLPSLDTPKNLGSLVPEAFKKWTSNVRVKTIDPVLIRGNLGEGSVGLNLKISGALGKPIPKGSVILNDAVLRLPFTTLKVSKGILKFNAKTGFNPIIDLVGNAEPRPYQVKVYAYGSMSDPQLVLTSQPPLPENEIMTLLASGTTTAGLGNSQQAASRAVQLLIEEFRRGRLLYGKELRPVLALLDDLDFSIADPDPYSSDVYNSATLKISERLSLSAGVDAGGDQRMMTTWRLKLK